MRLSAVCRSVCSVTSPDVIPAVRTGALEDLPHGLERLLRAVVREHPGVDSRLSGQHSLYCRADGNLARVVVLRLEERHVAVLLPAEREDHLVVLLPIAALLAGSGQTRTPHRAPYRSDTLWSIGQTMPAKTRCAHCRTVGFVRWEYVITGTTSRTIYYCGRCDHSWAVTELDARPAKRHLTKILPSDSPDRSRS